MSTERIMLMDSMPSMILSEKDLERMKGQEVELVNSSWDHSHTEP